METKQVLSDPDNRSMAALNMQHDFILQGLDSLQQLLF